MNSAIQANDGALAALHEHGVLAVLRGTSPGRVADAATTLVDAGIKVLEITYTVPECAEVIRQLKGTLNGAVLGAGTVTTEAELESALGAGADFIVTPGATPRLLTALAGSGVPFLPGVLTPSEVMVALEAGAPGVKLFPGSLAGPAGLKALLGPFPELLVVPTGGVSPANVADWMAVGAYAVGAGSDLAPPAAVDGGDHDLIRANAKTWLTALAHARPDLHP